MNISILYGVSGRHHLAVSKVDAHMTFPRRIIRSFKENKVAGLCFGFGNVLALVPQTVGGGAPHIVAVLVVDPANVAGAIKPGFRGRTAPDVGRAHILLRLLVDSGKLAVRQGFRRNLIVDAGCAGAIGATGRQTAVEQIRPTTQRILKDLIAFPLVVVQFLPDNHFQPFIHQFGVEDGMEYGSARWGNAKDIEPFMAPKFSDNIILTKTERLMMSNRPPDPKNARNKNVLVVGGSGSGKTRFWLKPNLLQCHSSYVVTDPKGSIVVECGNALLKNGYKLKILNTINFKKSMHYNPFAYVHSEKDILKLVTTLMTNTKGEGSGGDPFWEKSERLLLTALIAYLHYEAPMEEQNFATLLEMLNTMQVLEDDEEYQNPVDLLFEELAKKKPNSFAGRQYKLYKLAAGKTAKSILISCGARLAPFDIQELRDLTMYDELQLDTMGDKKTALFLIMSDTDSTFNFLISMVYTQLFNLLCDKADDVYGGKLPIHVRCLIDECANIGQIPNLEKLVATIRSHEISACLVLQARSQLKAIYKDNADTIVGNMDSQIFLGGSEPTTLKDLSEMLGKETIDAFNTSDTRGNSPSYGTTFQKMGHELLSRDELAVLDGGKCILQLRGVRPFLSDKYDLTQHPNYKLTSDYDPKNTFDIEKYLNRKEKINPNDEFVVIDADSLPSA